MSYIINENSADQMWNQSGQLQFPSLRVRQTQTLGVPLGMQPSASNSIFSPRPTMQSNTDNIGHLTMTICFQPTRTVFVFFPRPDTAAL